jgi:hypothetical protein
VLFELFEVCDSVCEVKEGCENELNDGKPSKEDEPPPVEEDDV